MEILHLSSHFKLYPECLPEPFSPRGNKVRWDIGVTLYDDILRPDHRWRSKLSFAMAIIQREGFQSSSFCVGEIPKQADHHQNSHESNIEDVGWPLIHLEVSRLPGLVFDETIDVSNDDEDTAEIKRIKRHWQTKWWVQIPREMRLRDPFVKDDGAEKEYAEKEHLETKTAKNSVLCRCDLRWFMCVDELASTGALNQEANYITADEELGQPVDSDEGELRVSWCADQPSEEHIDGSGEDDGREKDEQDLNDVWARGSNIVVGDGSSRKANHFDYPMISTVTCSTWAWGTYYIQTPPTTVAIPNHCRVAIILQRCSKVRICLLYTSPSPRD